jgi:hypothetical protein
MDVKIKQFDVEMEVKNNGVEFEIREPSGGAFLGDCVLTKTGLVWCKGKTSVEKGVKKSWKEFIAWAETED